MEYCLAPNVQLHSPDIDLAQGGFRPRRGVIDQDLCLHELMHIHRIRRDRPPAIAFLEREKPPDTMANHLGSW
jgi:hypothetical protein